MYIRKAADEDLETILSIYAFARDFQNKTGNRWQWTNGYPQRELLENDILTGNLYVCAEGEEILGVFAYFIGEDETYQTIKKGKWLNDEPYGTIHRIASSGHGKGVAAFCFDWVQQQCRNIRIDTHRDNKVMRAVLKKAGFVYCGESIAQDGRPRLAYQRRK